MTANLIYRKYSQCYREKSMQLNQLFSQDDQFIMTDFERIQLQRLAQKYMVMRGKNKHYQLKYYTAIDSFKIFYIFVSHYGFRV